MKKKIIVALTLIACTQSILAYADTATTTTASSTNATVSAPKKDYKLDATKEAAPAADSAAKKDTSWLSGFSGNFDLTSNYVFRGVSNSENLPAAQGGITYTFPIGLYLNVWGSNVKFTGTDATVELDTIIGWRGGIGDNFKYDINVDRYNYPGARELNYNELNILVNYRFIQASIGYSANAYNFHKTGIYYNGGINYDIPPQYIFNWQGMNFQALLGHYSLPRAAGNSYNDYNIALSKALNDTYTIMVQWVSTNGRQHMSPYDGSQIVGTFTANF
ncbi:MAG TPA: TorF family putative porin [Gammaproteobacteria bacterium]|jgi:uncharacterized protein (TIGR02001 family)|nr:TorF family putative porin [Gammaproteobacteria bacterium]